MGNNSEISVDAISCAARESISAKPSKIFRTIAAIIVSMIPAAYFGIILGVLIHEIVGHGLVSLAVGGDFLGFQIDYDGMGYATVPFWNNSTWQQVAILSGGVISTTIFGLAMMYGAYILRFRPWASLPLLVVSVCILLDGLPYLFWNSVAPHGYGDIARILEMTGSVWLRIILIVIGGVSMMGITWLFTLMMFLLIQSLISDGGELKGRGKLAVLILLGAAPGLFWFTFGWDQLVPGVNGLPNYVGLGIHLASAVSLLWLNFKPLQLKTSNGFVITAVLSWVLVGIAIGSMALWLREGLYWGKTSTGL